ncbi:unnamed protein product [Brachionus calyciflorus]|uniref:Uncharacterized protein n=1 Tax=Brachionus calyciflorus TaxID=104777 RepID=A0A814FGB8_9BILA|nr:unnamed protein product [Brachionus calyciflorus]
MNFTAPDLYKIVKQRPITEELRKRQLKFIGHCLRMPTDEPANIYVLYQSKVRERNKIGRPRAQYIEQISRFLIDKRSWRSLITEPQNPDRNDDDDQLNQYILIIKRKLL